MKSLWVLLALSSAAVGSADPIDDYVRAAMKKDHIPGVCVAIMPPGKPADVRAYGDANLETLTPFRSKTVFRIASLSKQFCAYAVLKMVKEGKLSLTDNLLKFFPKGHADWSKITIRHMLAHRSGIAEPGNAFNYRAEYSPEAYVDVLSKLPLAEEPGATYRYNNHGYALLGLIVGQVSKSSLPAVVSKSIFEPLGMKDARYYTMEDIIPNRGEAYRWSEGKYVRPLMIRPSIFHGSGGILMSMDDMVKYEEGLRKSLLDPEILRQQRTTYDGKDRGYGAGWFMSKPGGKVVAVHTGGTFGFTSAFVRQIDEGWTIILFRNSEGGEVDEWADEILKLAKGGKL